MCVPGIPSMPELPEVEASRCLLESHYVGQIISGCSTSETGGGPRTGQFDPIVIGEGVTGGCLEKAICGRKVEAAHRRGKQVWLELDGLGPHLLMHFGMTGAWGLQVRT